MPCEWQALADHEVHDHAECPQVDLLRVWLLQEYLRCYICRSAAAIQYFVLAADNLRQPKICYLDILYMKLLLDITATQIRTHLHISLELHQDILWLQVSMQDATAMDILNTLQ